MVKDINPFGVRMPPDIKAELEKLAEQNRRSLNAEIVVRLEESIKREKERCISEEALRRIVSDELDKRRPNG
jgi:hypothetical protein